MGTTLTSGIRYRRFLLNLNRGGGWHGSELLLVSAGKSRTASGMSSSSDMRHLLIIVGEPSATWPPAGSLLGAVTEIGEVYSP
jgi:hypothetical protein